MLVELSMVEQRYLAVREVLDTGASVTDVATRYGVDRRTLHRWLVRYANEGMPALADRSSRPDRCPHQIKPEVEAMMGYFANLLPLRIEIDPTVRFADVVKATKDLVLDSLGNPDIRLEDLMSELSVRTASGGRMLYQSLFSFQDIRQRELNWGNVTHERRALPHPGVTEDLAIWFVEELDKLSAAVVYNTELFRPESADLMHQRYMAIIEAVATDPFRPIAELTRFEGLADHVTAVERSGTGPLAENQRVRMKVQQGQKGLEAVSIESL